MSSCFGFDPLLSCLNSRLQILSATLTSSRLLSILVSLLCFCIWVQFRRISVKLCIRLFSYTVVLLAVQQVFLLSFLLVLFGYKCVCVRDVCRTDTLFRFVVGFPTFAWLLLDEKTAFLSHLLLLWTFAHLDSDTLITWLLL
ncbi:hypothetical protein ATANTOWER_019546 [Ataeniobius toweri]|uniref:Uncharacterized protein n=1 Tax=Ataeniobius toweri TaxID=208326 RepID=A0ABU7B7J3_9TELE|nr:hypothetical protein [Ataeniobius toweri]